MIIINREADVDRSEAYKAYAEGRANGEIILPPLFLSKHERRLHVRRTLREDHQRRIHNRPEGAQVKFDKLAESAFSFFRGTALLYYRDYAGTDAHLPLVFTIGDVHPENFGVMPNEDGAPIFGVNDFDEAWVAPFSYDVKRGAVGFYIVAKEKGLKKKHRRKVIGSFVNGYLKALEEFASDDRENTFQFRIDNSPKMIQKLLKGALDTRKAFLEDLIDLDKGHFIPTGKIVPHSGQVNKFQRIVNQYKKDNEIGGREKPKNFFQVKDVAIKKGSGTASLGLDRYFVLVEGWSEAISDRVVLEMKQARRSALYGLVPANTFEEAEHAEQIVMAHQVHLVGGDPFYGQALIDDESFLVRERSPFKDDIDVEDLSQGDLMTYAAICGRTLAQPHARSDKDTGIMEGDAEKRILQSIKAEVFCDDVIDFAESASRRIYADYALFQRDQALGVFSFLHNA
jgi:uncharacterized protein (DUF2252 family)